MTRFLEWWRGGWWVWLVDEAGAPVAFVAWDACTRYRDDEPNPALAALEDALDVIADLDRPPLPVQRGVL